MLFFSVALTRAHNINTPAEYQHEEKVSHCTRENDHCFTGTPSMPQCSLSGSRPAKSGSKRAKSGLKSAKWLKTRYQQFIARLAHE